MSQPIVIGYLYGNGANPAKVTQAEAKIRAKARGLGLDVSQILRDLAGSGRTRPARAAALDAIRTRRASVLIVPAFATLTRHAEELFDLCDPAFADFTRARLVAVASHFDSADKTHRIGWACLRHFAQLEAEITYQRDGHTLH
jgi:hypothetical protein